VRNSRKYNRIRHSPGKPTSAIVAAAGVFLWFLFAAFQTTALPSEELKARVVKIIDGDTIIVKFEGGERSVRLLGIDSPELGKDGSPPEYAAHEAKKFLEKLILGKKVRLRFDLEREDRYGRLLCYVYSSDGTLVNELLVREGLALVISGFSFRLKNRFREAQDEARKNKRGMFSLGGREVALYSIDNFEPIEVFPGPSRTFTIKWKNMVLPLVPKERVGDEIRRIRRYSRIYPPDKLTEALTGEGYIPLSRASDKRPETQTRRRESSLIYIGYRQALQHVGEEVIVVGKIVRTKKTEKVIFLDFDRDWRNNLSLVIFRRNWGKFPYRADSYLKGKKISVQGRIRLYKGKPEIIVESPGQIKVLDR